MSLTKDDVLQELSQHEETLKVILSGFTHGERGLFILPGHKQGLLRCVRETIDLLHSALGRPNDYANRISSYYDFGKLTFNGSQSHDSVSNILAELQAVQTHIKRPTTVLVKNGSMGVGKSEDVGTRVFIGHGRSKEWKDLKDFINDRMRLPWDEFNRVPVAGISNAERLSAMLDAAAIAFLVLTAEDETADGKFQARMNVIHEAGLFQGRLGFNRAIVMLEEGCEDFSNIHGVGQLRFPKGNIRAAFHDVELVLEREGLVEAR